MLSAEGSRSEKLCENEVLGVELIVNVTKNAQSQTFVALADSGTSAMSVSIKVTASGVRVKETQKVTQWYTKAENFVSEEKSKLNKMK